jgi:CRISPR-associated protein Csm4
MNDVGLHGFGRDASIGLGKFAVEGCEALSSRRLADTVVTLAPCRPRPDEVEAEKSYWRPFTRFGRHGGPSFGGKVFKTPVLLADTGAMFTASAKGRGGPFLGRGLGGNGRLSRQIPQTVHQAYAPVLPVDLEGWDG